MTDKCDICGTQTRNLSDIYCIICPQCRKEHTDMILIRRIGQLMNKIEDLENANN